MSIAPASPCPCGRKLAYVACCGRWHRLHESSRFVREDGCWFYLQGHIA